MSYVHGNIEIVKLLLADPSFPNNNALMIAWNNRHYENTCLLLSCPHVKSTIRPITKYVIYIDMYLLYLIIAVGIIILYIILWYLMK